MARKKFNTKRIMTKIGGASVGGAVGQASNKVLGKLNPKIGAGVKILAGAIVPEVVKGEFMDELGSGMIGVGAAELTRNLVPGLAGIGEWNEDYTLGAFDEDYTSQDEYDMSGIGNEYEDDNAIGDINDEVTDDGY